MEFEVLSVGERVPVDVPNKTYLIEDNWDDYFEFSTLYTLVVVDGENNKHNIGGIKIGQFKMETRRPDLPISFTFLDDDRFFSVGLDDSYYKKLNELGDEIRDSILQALNDIALNEQLYEKSINEKVTKVSLLRFISPTSIKGQFRRLANGGSRLSQYTFSYLWPKLDKSSSDPLILSFNVVPESNPPTNVHVLTGRNGVGKTYLINNMITSLIDINPSPSKVGLFKSENNKDDNLFANVVSVTFSAFDESEPPPERRDKSIGIQYSYIGLKRDPKDNNFAPKSPVMLKNEFIKSVLKLQTISKKARWRRALEVLEADPIIKGSEIVSIVDIFDEEEFKKEAGNIFNKLSSGHKIVLLTITRLVETVEERSLILIDEPEAHLHPPLLSAFIRSLSDLLIERNGVAIIATHSPVVLQEVPKSCVWMLRRSGQNVNADRLEIESFGENVGVLTSEVFGLEVTHSGFHKLLSDAATNNDSYEDAINSFGNQLGMEAKSILRALYSSKSKGKME